MVEGREQEPGRRKENGVERSRLHHSWHFCSCSYWIWTHSIHLIQHGSFWIWCPNVLWLSFNISVAFCLFVSHFVCFCSIHTLLSCSIFLKFFHFPLFIFYLLNILFPLLYSFFLLLFLFCLILFLFSSFTADPFFHESFWPLDRFST